MWPVTCGCFPSSARWTATTSSQTHNANPLLTTPGNNKKTNKAMSRHALSPLSTRATCPGQRAALKAHGEAVTNLANRGEFSDTNFSLEVMVEEMNLTISSLVFELPAEPARRSKVRDSFKFVGLAKWMMENLDGLYAALTEKECMAEELAVEKERMAEELALEKNRMAKEMDRIEAEKDNLVAELVAENVSLVAENSRLEELLEKDQEMRDAPPPRWLSRGSKAWIFCPCSKACEKHLKKGHCSGARQASPPSLVIQLLCESPEKRIESLDNSNRSPFTAKKISVYEYFAPLPRESHSELTTQRQHYDGWLLV